MTNETEGQTAYEAFKEWWGTAHRRARGRFNAFEAGVQFAEGRVSESRPSTVSGTTDYLRSVVEQVHRDTHDALEAVPVEASRTPVETAEVVCASESNDTPCWHCVKAGGCWIDLKKTGISYDDFLELERPVPPSPEAVEPPLTDERCETCGHPKDGHPTTADHHLYGHPFKPVSPPLQEGGGWTREDWNPGYALWTDGQERCLVPLSIEEAIRSEDNRGFVVMTEPESQSLARLTSDLASSEAENRRLQAALRFIQRRPEYAETAAAIALDPSSIISKDGPTAAEIDAHLQACTESHRIPQSE